MRSSISLRAVLVLLTAVALWSSPAGAQVVGTWNANDNGLWSQANKWLDGIIPTSAGDTANITFPLTRWNRTITIDGAVASRTVGILNIGNSSRRYSIASSGEGTLTFDNLGSTAQINVPGSKGASIDAPVLLNNDLEIRCNYLYGGLTIDGTVTANSAGAKTISNLGTNNGSVQILSDIADGGGGTVAILQNSVKSMLILGGDSSYTGATTVSAGVLQIQNSTALGTTDAGTSVAPGAALQMQGGITVGAEALALNGTGVSDDGVLRNMGGTNTYGGLVTLGSAARINSDNGTLTLSNAGTITGDGLVLTVGGSGNTTINSIIGTGAAALNKDGGGTLTLSGANTYTGGTNISGGTLVLSGAGTLGDSANALTMSGARLDLGGTSQTVGAVSITAGAGSADTIGNGSLTGTSYSASNASGNAIVSANLLGDAALTMSGAGTLTVSGTNTYAGGTTVSDGVLLATKAAALPGYSSADKVIFDGGTVGASVGGAGWTTTQVDTLLAGATKNSGALGIDTTGGDLAQWTSFTTTNLGPALGLTKLGSNTLTLDQVNSYAGTTTITGGTLKLQDTAAGLTQTLGALTLAGADVTLQSDNAGSGALSTTFGALTARAAGNTADIVSTGGTNGTDNLINLTGAAGFIDAGVFFGGANYAAIDATGYVRALAYGTDPGTSALFFTIDATHAKLTASPAARAGDTLSSLNLAGDGVDYTMNSGTLTTGGILKSGGGASTISGGTAVATDAEVVIRTDTSSDLLTISTPVTGAGALTKSGAGTLTLSGVNSYTGATVVNGGTLEIGGAGRVGNGNYAGAIAIADGATFNYKSTATQTLTSAISGGGTLTKTGGTLTLSGANTGFNGTVTLNGGTLVLNNAGALGNASSLTIAGGTSLQTTGNVPAINTPITLVGTGNAYIQAVTGGASLDINAPISGDGNLQLGSTHSASSYFALNAKSDYTGNTIFYASTPGNYAGWIYVAIGIDDALPTGTVLSMGGNFAQFDLSGHNQTLGGLSDRVGGPGGGWAVLGWEIVNSSATPTTLTVNNAANYTFSGRLGTSSENGNFGLTKGGAGTLTLADYLFDGGVHTYTGETVINSGMLEIAGAAKLGSGAYAGNISVASGAVFKYNSTAAQTLSGTISGAGRLIKDGAGTLTLTGGGASVPIANVNGGTLTLDYNSQDSSKLSDSAELVLGGGTVNLSGGTHTEVVASTKLSAGASSVTRTSGDAVLQMGAISPGGVVNFGADNIATTTNSNDAGGILGAWASVGGTDWAANDGSGNIVAYTGGYADIAATGDTITDGSASNVRINSAGAGGDLALSDDTTNVNTLLQNTATAATIDTFGKTLAVGGIRIGSGQEAVTVGALAGDGTLTAAAAGGVLVLNNGNTAKTLTVNAAIADNTSASSLATVGNVLLNGVNSYTGATSVGGTLEIGEAGQLGGGAYGGDISFAGGGVFKYTSSAAQTLSGGISIAGDATISNATALRASGAISGSGALIKTGDGTLSLTNTASDYSGVTKISAGTLEVSKLANAGLPSSIGLTGTDLVLGDGGTVPAPVGLRYLGAGDSTDSGFLFNGNGLVTVTLDASGTGPINFTSTANFAHSHVHKPRTLILTGENTDDNTLAASIESNGNQIVNIVKNGPGTWVLSGSSSNLYQPCAMTVNEGTLKVNGSRIGSPATVNSGGAFAGSGGSIKSLTLNNGAGYIWGYGDGGDHTMDMAGDLTLNDAWILNLVDLGDSPEPTEEYDLFTFTGNFNGEALTEAITLIEGANYTVDTTYAPDWNLADMELVVDAGLTTGFRLYVTGISGGMPGDADGDGDVDSADYIMIKRHFGGAPGAEGPGGDLNGDDIVDWDDLQILQTALNANAGAGDTIPEPATLFITLAAGLPALLKRRRSRS